MHKKVELKLVEGRNVGDRLFLNLIKVKKKLVEVPTQYHGFLESQRILDAGEKKVFDRNHNYFVFSMIDTNVPQFFGVLVF